MYLGAFDTEPPASNSAVYFTIDDALPYNSFHHDFGPLHIGHLYRFAVMLHDIFWEADKDGKAVVLYSGTDPRLRANAACVLCCYMVLLQSWPPHLALAPIAQADPPFMPFRDAGYAVADFVLTIQDVVYGVWRAKEQKLLDLTTFNLEEYELYERVDQGDFNEIPPHFVAFASPVQTDDEPMSHSFAQVLDYFESHDVKLVVRLNSHLYDKREFERRGIRHVDLVFEDGTCPTMLFVQAFIGAVEGVIAEGGKVAVHCKAGLGRTGCLIGAHLIYTYGFTASEAIAYMRFLRPGMVVGPQQHWLYLHQNEFREWRRTMTLSRIADDSLAGYSPLVALNSPEARDAGSSANGASGRKGAAASRQSPPRTPERSILGEIGQSSANTALPVPTPGQPRKNSPSPAARRTASTSIGNSVAGPRRAGSTSAYRRTQENSEPSRFVSNSDDENDAALSGDEQPLVVRKPSDAKRSVTESLSQQQQMLMGAKIRSMSNSASPQRSRRTASYQYTTTTTTTTTISSSPPVPIEDIAPLRRSTRIMSNGGVRKASGSRRK